MLWVGQGGGGPGELFDPWNVVEHLGVNRGGSFFRGFTPADMAERSHSHHRVHAALPRYVQGTTLKHMSSLLVPVLTI